MTPKVWLIAPVRDKHRSLKFTRTHSVNSLTALLFIARFVPTVADITHGKAKVIASVIFELFWSIGLIMLPGLTIFFTNYTNLYMAVSMPTIVLIFLHRSVIRNELPELKTLKSFD